MTALKPYAFQERGIEWLCRLERGGILADDMGLGKTLQVIRAAVELKLKRCLIVVQNSTRSVWHDEIKKWAPDVQFTVIDPYWMTHDQRRSAILDRQNRFVVVSYQMMLRLKDTLNRVYWDVVVFDEAQTLRNRHSQTHKASRLLTRKSSTARVWALTGTPVQNHAEDYWPILRMFVPGFGSYWDFARKYCNVEEVVHPRTRQVLGSSVTSITDENDPRIRDLVEQIRPYVLRRMKEQVYPDMPQKTSQDIHVRLDPTSRRLYKSMLERMSVILPTKDEITVDTELAQTTRLLQLSTSWQLLAGERCRSWSFDGPKAEVLDDLVFQLDGQPFVIFSQWSRVIDMIANRLQVPSSRFTGENVRTRDRELDEWNRGKTQALLVTIDAGGVGLNFTRASTAIFVDRSWNPKKNEQAEDRLHRHGQTQSVNIINIIADETIESNSQSVSLDLKTQVAEAIVEVLAV